MPSIKLAIVLVTLSSTTLSAAASHRTNPIFGAWTWNERGLSPTDFAKAMHDEPSYTFTFHPNGQVETLVFMPHVFSNVGGGGGEGLGDAGHYHLVGNQLIITRAHQPADGWPTKTDTAPYQYSCRYEMAGDRKSFTLSGCIIAGTWVKYKSP